MVVRSNLVAIAAAVAALGIAGTMISGCASQAPATLSQKLDEEGATHDSVPANMVQPDGTLSNGLLPEAWGDTN